MKTVTIKPSQGHRILDRRNGRLYSEVVCYEGDAGNFVEVDMAEQGK